MSFVQKFKDLVGKNADKVGPAVDKIGDVVDEKTKGKYKSQVDMAQQKAKEAADGMARESEKRQPPMSN